MLSHNTPTLEGVLVKQGPQYDYFVTSNFGGVDHILKQNKQCCGNLTVSKTADAEHSRSL